MTTFYLLVLCGAIIPIGHIPNYTHSVMWLSWMVDRGRWALTCNQPYFTEVTDCESLSVCVELSGAKTMLGQGWQVFIKLCLFQLCQKKGILTHYVYVINCTLHLLLGSRYIRLITASDFKTPRRL